MSLSIANNVASLNAQHNVTKTNNSLSKSLERLSSGLKINRGADGPAALVISEKQRAQIAGLNAAIDNTEKATSLVQTGEGALNEINTLLVKVRSLAIDSANAGVNDSEALAANQAEIANALNTIDRIAANTQFGTKKLLDGSAGVVGTTASTDLSAVSGTGDTGAGTFTITNVDQIAQKGRVDLSSHGTQEDQLDDNTNLSADEVLTFNGTTDITLSSGSTIAQVVDTINAETETTGVVASADATTGNLVLTAAEFGGNFTVESDIATATAGATGIGTTEIDTDITPAGFVTEQGLDIQLDISGPSGQQLNNFTGSGNVVTATSGEFAGLSFTVAADGTNDAVSADVTGDTIDVSGGLTFQIGANAGQTATLSFADASSTALGTGISGNQFASLNAIDISTADGAQDALAVIDSAIDTITNQRGTLGAFQSNTLESTANNLRATLENTVAAESTIRDTDFAEEIANFTKQQVLLQAGTSILGNANQTPQLILSLLN